LNWTLPLRKEHRSERTAHTHTCQQLMCHPI
jgi:hypothetical protein